MGFSRLLWNKGVNPLSIKPLNAKAGSIEISLGDNSHHTGHNNTPTEMHKKLKK